MTKTRLLASLALLANLIGSILVTLSFQATSSDFRLITAHWSMRERKPSETVKSYAICANNNALAIGSDDGSVGLGMHGCPDWENGRPSAVVTAEHPWMLYAGLILSIIGFLGQLLLILFTPAPTVSVKTPAE
jgi:hypothetical protein